MSLTELTYLCELDYLDSMEARFTAGTSGTELTLKRENWHTIGRPTTVFITPTGDDPHGRNR